MPLLPSCSSKPVWLSCLFFVFYISVDLVFFPMKGYPMLLGPQCSSTYLLLCLTEESKSYRILNDTRVRKWLKNVYFWVKHNSCITLYWIVGLHWYYYEMEWDWITEKWKRRVLLGPLMLNGVKNPRHAVSLIFGRDVALTSCRELTAIAP